MEREEAGAAGEERGDLVELALAPDERGERPREVRCGRDDRSRQERRLLAHDRGVQLAQRRARADPELFGERVPCRLIGGEGLRLATVAVEGKHEA